MKLVILKTVWRTKYEANFDLSKTKKNTFLRMKQYFKN